MRVGQYNLPAWDQFKEVVDGIYDRKYYTNHGPLLKQLEDELSEFFKVNHAVCMTNMDIALMISLLALDLKKNILLPAFSPIAIAQNIIWSGLHPVYCDNDPGQPNLSAKKVEGNLSADISAVIAIHNWGNACDIEAIGELAIANNLKLIYCSSDVIGQTYKGRVHGGNGNLEIFSFHEKEMINGGDGACVTTNDDHLAARLRNIRSSYGARHPVKIPYTGNGRMSEIQAGLIIQTLKDLENNRHTNKQQYETYRQQLELPDGITLFEPDKNNESLNYNRLIILLDKTRTALVPSAREALSAIGCEVSYGSDYVVDANGLTPLTDAKNALLLRNSIELPLGRLVSTEDISKICSVINRLFMTDGHS